MIVPRCLDGREGMILLHQPPCDIGWFLVAIDTWVRVDVRIILLARPNRGNSIPFVDREYGLRTKPFCLISRLGHLSSPRRRSRVSLFAFPSDTQRNCLTQPVEDG